MKIRIRRGALRPRGTPRLQDLPAARQLQGKELSYNNLVDLEARLGSRLGIQAARPWPS